MWLDRFSQQPSPAGTPAGRNSPAPRRGPYLSPQPLPPRPGLNPRSSSLTSLSAASSTSLLNDRRAPSPSHLRNQLYNAPPSDVPDPLQVLEETMGGPPRKRRSLDKDRPRTLGIEKPEQLVEDVDFGGLSLQEFADQAESVAPRASNARRLSVQSIQEFDKERDKFEDLHRSIAACDEVLKSVETYLTGFQADLGAVSSEIETLQTRSTALNTKLENRRIVEKHLGPAVEEVSLSPAIVRKIAEGPVDESWVAALAELEKKSKSIKAKSEEQAKVKAVEDLKPLLDELSNRAVERIRDHIVTQIKALRSPNINAQIIQQQSFLKYRDLFTFLSRRQPNLAEEITQAYVNTMRWYYSHHFTRYRAALDKLKLHVIDKNDVLGQQEDSTKRGASTGAKIAGAPHDAFSLGRRLDVLKNASSPALSSYIAEEDKSTHYLEVPFHAFNIALLDNASFEYTFLSTFFSPSQSYHAISRTFDSIFGPTFALGRSFTKQLIDTSMDALGILLCVRLNQHFAFELQRRKVPAVEGYVNGTNMLLWPRFQLVLDAHCTSLRQLTSSLTGRPAASGLLGSSSASSAPTTAPHALTQRFANLLQGILALSAEAGDDEPVSNSLARLRNEFEAWLTKLSKGISEQRKRERFLNNNYSLIGTILENETGRLAEEMQTHFGGLRDVYAKQ